MLQEFEHHQVRERLMLIIHAHSVLLASLCEICSGQVVLMNEDSWVLRKSHIAEKDLCKLVLDADCLVNL